MRRKTVFTLPIWAPPAALLAVALAGLWLIQRSPSSHARASASASAESAADRYERERRERAQRVCEQTAERITRGATVSEADVEGWVVELNAVRVGPAPRPLGQALSAFIRVPQGQQHGRIIWSEAPALAALDGPTTHVRLSHGGGEQRPGAEPERVTLTFSGRYVSPYFVEAQRPAFVQLAAAFAEQFGATHAGLYARCEHGTSHHLGTWFRGESAGAAVAALVVWMGAHAVVPFLDESSLGVDAGGRLEPSGAFAVVAQNARRLDRADIARIIGEQGGMISGKPAGPTTLSFAFRDGNRATRASLDLARSLGVARVSAR